MLTMLFVLNWILAMAIVCGIFKYDFGEVTVGDFVFLGIISLIPISSIAAFFFGLIVVTQNTGFSSKKLF